MKKFYSFTFVIVAAIMVAVSTQGCKKKSTDSPTPDEKGCNDPEAINYSATAKGTDCTYPPDKLAGTWKVSEYESKDSITLNYTATITKVDNKTVHIKHNSDYPSSVPSWDMDNLTLQINWADKVFVPTGTITGTISDVNSKWTVSYTSGVYKVKQTYTK